ncbi:MAG: hypothetical protein ACYC46_15720 [Acidobacteriaceae bacterium]
MKRFVQMNLVAALALTSLTALAMDMSSKPAKITGWISDSKCGAMHNAKSPNPACVSACIKSGQKPVFVDDAKNEVWTIENPAAVKPAEYGQHVTIMATENASKKELHISKLMPMGSQVKGSSMGSMEHMN